MPLTGAQTKAPVAVSDRRSIMPTVARNIVDTLVESGVKRVYGIPGDSLNGFTDACGSTPNSNGPCPPRGGRGLRRQR